MRQQTRWIAAAMALFALGGRAFMALRSAQAQSSKPAKTEWATYGNARYKYFVDYPKNLFTQKREADNSDGCTFTTRDGKTRMFVYGSNNVTDDTLQKRFDQDSRRIEVGDKVTYKAKKANWYAVSGYRGSDIFYRKTFLRDDQFITLELTYPKSDRATWDKIVSHITPTFQLGK